MSRLSAPAQAALTAVCREMEIPPGQTLFHQGMVHTSSYIIRSGLIRTCYTSPSGREITLAFWSDGELIGGPNFFGGGIHVWSGVSARRSTVLAIRDPDLARLAKQNPEILYWITETLTFKLHWLSILFQLHGTEPVLNRLAKLLMILSDVYGERQEDGILVRCKLSQGDLSTLVGASRQWTNRSLNELRKAGLLTLESRQIRIVDPERLRRLCER